jgi:glycosyltransferase involved in cell wall biosynthesis
MVSVANEAAHLEALHQTLKHPSFTPEQRHFFYWQRITRHGRVGGGPELEPAALYASLLESCRQSVNIQAPWVAPASRDGDSVIVITNQLLGLQHAPTADCMDYCHLLQTRLKKKVFLINTADMPWSLALAYYNPMRFNYSAEYSNLGKLTFKDELIDFYQCRKPMPNREETGAIVTTVLTRKPAFVFSLGHSNVAADLCAEFLTVATMPFGTDLPRAQGTVFILPRARRADDAEFMQAWHIRDEQVVEAGYTFRLPERTASVTRGGLGLPDDAYVIAIVGNRLDEEITDPVAAELSQLLSSVPQAFLAFLGMFPGYPRLAQRDPALAARSVFLGYHKDVLAVFECCDAYFNPPRYGGGSSAAFALAMGLPVLTRATGDVANIAGPRFVRGSFEEIAAFVRRTVVDADHRREWSTAARARFDEISDREGMLRTIVEEVATRAGIRRSR